MLERTAGIRMFKVMIDQPIIIFSQYPDKRVGIIDTCLYLAVTRNKPAACIIIIFMIYSIFVLVAINKNQIPTKYKVYSFILTPRSHTFLLKNLLSWSRPSPIESQVKYL